MTAAFLDKDEVHHPYHDNVLVLFDLHNPEHPDHPANRRTAGGLHVPEQVRPEITDPVPATVIAAGPGHYAEWDPSVWLPNQVKAGDRVLVDGKQGGMLTGDRVEINGVEHRMVREHQIAAVIE